MWRFFPPVAKKPRPTPEEGGEGGESSNVPAPVDVELEGEPQQPAADAKATDDGDAASAKVTPGTSKQATASATGRKFLPKWFYNDVTGKIAIEKDVSLSGKISDLFGLKNNISISIIFF